MSQHYGISRADFKSHTTGPRVHTHASGYNPLPSFLVQGHWCFNTAVEYAASDIVTLVVTGFRCTQWRHHSERWIELNSL